MGDSQELLLIELMVKVSAMIKLLTRQDILSEAEIQQEMEKISADLVNQLSLLEKPTENTVSVKENVSLINSSDN